MLAGHICRYAPVVVAFQRIQQWIFRIVAHRQTVSLAADMAMFSNEPIVQRVEPSPVQIEVAFNALGLFCCHQSP